MFPVEKLVDHRSAQTEAALQSGVRRVVGEAAWARLPPSVRLRFAEPARRVDYVGAFEIVRASRLGRLIAWCACLLGTPVVAQVGKNIPAVVHVGPRGHGVDWHREYRWPNGQCSWVRSSKTIDRLGRLVERLPARLCMPLEVTVRDGVLHFISVGYYFDLTLEWLSYAGFNHEWHLPLPPWLSPGTTHVEHIDESDGWFRFTMRVTHRHFGELFYQTGRFRAAR
jgi:Domain of unknown function (DUF4166)